MKIKMNKKSTNMKSLTLCLASFLTLFQLKMVNGAFSQSQESDYLSNFNTIVAASYSAVDDPQSGVPSNLLSQCKKESVNYVVPSTTVTVSSNNGNIVTSSDVASQCTLASICIIPAGVTYKVTTSLNVGALVIRGSVEWTDSTQSSLKVYLCSGYVAVEGNGVWNMSVLEKKAWIYIKDNGAVHSMLRSRAFGAAASDDTNDYPIVHIKGRELVRTWSLLSKPLMLGDTTMKLLHNPTLMGWNIGDRVAIAPTKDRSEGYGAEFSIQSIASDGTITLSTSSPDNFDAEFFPPPQKEGIPALKSAEVVNLSRSIVISGDDFSNIPCDSSLPEYIPGEETSTLGCRCASFRSQCTMGLHTIQMHKGESRIEYTRVEKCGQRGVEGKYCLHFHELKDCSNCSFSGNAVENGHQRGIIVHGTHRSLVEDNIIYNIRGAGIYIEDGNEMFNRILYNVIICNFPMNHPKLHGCTVPGTSNRISDTSDNQTGIYSRAATNDLIGNRCSNSFNGMFLQALGMGRGSDNAGKVCEADARLGRIAGNVFHSHGRFGTYSLGNTFPKVTDQSIATNGLNSNLDLCRGFDADGNTRGLPVTIKENLDYGNAFVGHYNAGDIQYNGHHSIGNLNNIYWKETKNFQNGCSAHISNGYYAYGNMALPDQSTFIIEQTTFGNEVSLEANHHCNVGVTGYLCMPQYILHNVKWNNTVKGRKWTLFPTQNFQGHTANQVDGGIFTLSPPNADIVMQTGSLDGSLFPPGFVSLVSSRFTYLLSIPGEKCVLSSSLGSDMSQLYDNGILCKVPLRSLKVYSRGLVSGSAPKMLLKAWFDGTSGGTPQSSQEIIFHQIGNDYATQKQGYSFPVVPGTDNTYNLSLVGNDQNIPQDWVIEFSDWVVGNRWSVEYINLTLEGRTCPNNGQVSSHHDRRFLFSGDEFLPDTAWGNHGACVSSNAPPGDMPIINCDGNQQNGVLDPTECPGFCGTTCNKNSYCDCGSQVCMCKPGFGGANCSVDLCAAARCGEHGHCAATYLGSSSLLPVTSIDKACICDEGWSGNLCQYNPCETLQKSCSDHGTCTANGDLDAVCVCDAGYSGENCEQSCDGFCQGSYPYNCNPNLNDVVLYGCNQFGGCAYKKEGEGEFGSGICVFKQVSGGSQCTCSSDNECSVIGPCNDLGQCPEPALVLDGTPCNSIPWGVCQNGVCTPSVPAPTPPSPSPTPPTTTLPTPTPTLPTSTPPTPTPTPPTPTPPIGGGDGCGCNTCTTSVLNRDADGYSVISRINWVIANLNLSETQACRQVCGDEFPEVCSACNPDQCSGPSTTPPTLTPSSVPSIARHSCTNYSGRFQFRMNGKKVMRSCSWVASKDTDNRCAYTGVSSVCPVTCGTCSICNDAVSSIRFRFMMNGRYKKRNCGWVTRKPHKMSLRCSLSHDACRSSCGAC